jgi:hypothetical protein
MTNNTIIYSNSCSFGAPQGHPVYSDIIANKLFCESQNDGIGCSSNRRIIRTSLRSLIKLKQQGYTNIIALIGLSFLGRTELWQPHQTNQKNIFLKQFNESGDGDFYPLHNEKIHNLDWSKGINSITLDVVSGRADTEVKDYFKQWLIHYSKEGTICDLISDIIMLDGFAKFHGIKLLCFCNCQKFPGLPEVDKKAPFLIDFKEYLDRTPSIINFWDFSFADFSLEAGHRPKDEDLYGDNGHPSADAHRDFGNFLLDKLETLAYI